MRRILAMALAIQFGWVTTGCSHTVTIDTEPSGGEISVNGETLGKGPVAYTETTGWDKVYEVRAKKAGYKAAKRTLKQSEWNTLVVAGTIGSYLACGLLTMGTFLLIPLPLVGLLWSRQLPDRVVIPLEKAEAGGDSAPADDFGY